MKIIPSRSMWLSLMLSLVTNGFVVVNACNDYNAAGDLSSVGVFTQLDAVMLCSSEFRGGTLPSKVLYRIYFVSSGSQARFVSTPQFIPNTNTPALTPVVNNGILQFQWNGNLGGYQGDSIDAGVSIWVPMNYNFAKIKEWSLWGDTIFVDASQGQYPWNFEFEDAGFNTKYYLKMPSTSINFRAGLSGFSGTGHDSYLEADVLNNSKFYYGGVNSVARVTSQGGNVNEVKLEGTNNEFRLQGGWSNFYMNGSNGRAYINGGNGCNGVQGVGNNNNQCQTTTETYSVNDPGCTVSSQRMNLQFCYTTFFQQGGGSVMVGGSGPETTGSGATNTLTTSSLDMFAATAFAGIMSTTFVGLVMML